MTAYGAQSAFWPNDGRSRAHVPHMPFWQGILRIVQTVLALGVLILTAFAVSETESILGGPIREWDAFGLEAFPMSWFAFSWTTAYFIYLGVALMVTPVAYIFWIHMFLECLAVLWWLVSFALLADLSVREARARQALNRVNDDDDVFGFSSSTYAFQNLIDVGKTVDDCIYAATALAGLLWILFIVSLVYLGMAIHHHRMQSGPVMGERMTPAPRTAPQMAPAGSYSHDPRQTTDGQYLPPVNVMHTGSTAPEAILGPHQSSAYPQNTHEMPQHGPQAMAPGHNA